MRRPGSAADLLPVLEIGEDFFVTTDGRYGAVLECSGLNLRHRSAEGADAVAAAFRDLLDFLDPGAHLQLVVESAPLRPREWVGRYAAQFRPPPGLEGYVARTGAWLAGELSGHSIVRHSYYVVATLPGPPPPRLGRRLRRRLRGERALARERDEHHKAVADLGRVASEVADSLAALEISVSRLDGRAVAGLL